MDENLPSGDGFNLGGSNLEMPFQTLAPELGTAGNIRQVPTLKLSCDGERLEMAEQTDVKLMIMSRPNAGAIPQSPTILSGGLGDKASRACEIQVRVQLSLYKRVNNPPKRAKLARGLARSGYQKREWPEASCRPCSPSTRIPSTTPGPGHGRRRLRRPRRRLHPARVRQEGRAGRKAHPLPRRGHTWALQAGRGAGPAPGSSESGPPPRTAPWGPPDGPAARPTTKAGNGRRGCLERSRGRRGAGPGLSPPTGGGGATWPRAGTSKAM